MYIICNPKQLLLEQKALLCNSVIFSVICEQIFGHVDDQLSANNFVPMHVCYPLKHGFTQLSFLLQAIGNL